MLAAAQSLGSEARVLLCGDPAVWRRAADLSGVPVSLEASAVAEESHDPLPELGHPTVGGARIAWRALDQAIELVRCGQASAIVTGPISKANMLAAGFPSAGHTDYLQARAGAPRVLMVMSSPGFHVALHTVHIALAAVPTAIDGDRLIAEIELFRGFLDRVGEPPSRPIGVCGLNPHAGEGGHLGGEESQIANALDRCPRDGRPVVGPLPGDTAFAQMAEGRFAGVVAMYHDQGLAPFKLRAFHDGVNVSVGLPWVRTSPDHGTAFDLAGRGVARPDSAISAARLAVHLARVEGRRDGRSLIM
jgi:4-hydroxythreonine-4-phosphate dehydrogenase